MSEYVVVRHEERKIIDAVFAFNKEGQLLFSNRESLIVGIKGTHPNGSLCLNDIFAETSVPELLGIQNNAAQAIHSERQILLLHLAGERKREVEADLTYKNSTLFINLISLQTPPQVAYTFEEDSTVLNAMIDTFSIPAWCIEFQEPVDIEVSDRETIRQIFQNESRWRMCNKAFARLYNLPDALDINKQPVRALFPRSPENEKFISEVIENDYKVDNALSIDTNHDGSALYIENSVRAYIEDGKLLRLWGTARDITNEKRTENHLLHRETEIRGVLGAIADVILVVNRRGVLQGTNPAFEVQFGWNMDNWLGKDVNDITNIGEYLRGVSRLKVNQQVRFEGKVTVPDLSKKKFDISLSCFLDDMDEERFVGVFRPIEDNGQDNG